MSPVSILSTHRQNPSFKQEELCTRSWRVVLDGGPHQTSHSAAFLLEAGKTAIIASHVEVKKVHLHISGQTSLEGLIQVTHKPGGQSRDLAEAQMIELLDEILEVGQVRAEDGMSTRGGSMHHAWSTQTLSWDTHVVHPGIGDRLVLKLHQPVGLSSEVHRLQHSYDVSL